MPSWSAAGVKQFVEKRFSNWGSGVIALLFISFFFYVIAFSWVPPDIYPNYVKVPCTILGAEVYSEKHRPALAVHFSYEADGVLRTNAYVDSTFIWFEDAYEHISKYPVGKRTHCRINPSKPENAVLKTFATSIRQRNAAIPFILGSLPWLIILATPETAFHRRYFYRFQKYMWLFATLLVSLPMLLLSAEPLFNSLRSHSWEIHPYKMEGSYEVIRKHPKRSKTRVVRFVSYSYEFNGQTWYSNRHRFGWSGYHLLPTCLVNPSKPYQAVIIRDLQGLDWAILVPISIPFGLVFWWWRSWPDRSRKKKKSSFQLD